MRRARWMGVGLTVIAGCYSGNPGAMSGSSTSEASADASTPSGSATTQDASAEGTSATSPTPTPTSSTGPVTGSSGEPTSGTSDGSSGSTTTTGGPVVPPCPYDAVDGSPTFALETVATGLTAPLFAIGHPTEPDRLFVLETNGVVQMFEPGSTTAVDPPPLEIDVQAGGESGLFSLAFHPDFPDDPRIYLNYTVQNDGRTRIEEYTLDPNNDYAGDLDSARTILELYQPAGNHNAGGMTFIDGWLVIGMGDGGTSSTSRNPEILQAKFLRIGIEPDGEMDDPIACEGCPTYGPFDYTIPDDNPFLGDPGVAPEIWAMGFRNPWRWSYDPQSDLAYVGDVGAGSWEEISVVEAGHDYGWVDMEGFHCNSDGSCDEVFTPNAVNADGLTMPIHEVAHGAGDCAIIGGAVYRSCEVPDWDGVYLYTDYCNNDIRAVRWDGATLEDLGVVIEPPRSFLGNGWNAWGDVYFTGGNAGGEVQRIVPAR